MHIEKSVRLCCECHHLLHHSNPESGLPDHGLNYARPFEGKNILVAIDTHSKSTKVICTPSTSSAITEVLRTLLTSFGLPKIVVTNNGTGFVGQEFERVLRSNGTKRTTPAPYHSASNELAERAMQLSLPC